MSDVDTVVIGSGAGGLTAALALARAGQRVLVLESHYLPGGWCHSFPLEGYQFSPGVHYIGDVGPDQTLRRIWEGLGIANDLVLLELNRDGYDHVQIGDRRFDIPAGLEPYRERLKRQFPREAAGIDTFLDVCMGLRAELGQLHRIKGPMSALKIAARSPMLAKWGMRSVQSLLDATVSDPFLRGILSIQSGNHGVAPSTAPNVVHGTILAHYFDGGFYPMGGARSIPRAYLKALRKAGGSIKLKSEVRTITIEIVDGKRKATGVVLADGTEIRADRVVSNADPNLTFDKLVGHEHLGWRLKRKLKKTTYGKSCLSLFMAADTDPRAFGLDSGNLWYSPESDINGQYQHASAARDIGAQGLKSMFLTATTLKDPTKVKNGHHTLEAFTYASQDQFSAWQDSVYEQRPQGYTDIKALLKERMLDTLDTVAPGLRDHLVMAELGTPVTNKHFVQSTDGHMYGTEKSRGQIGPLGFGVTTEIEGLYLAGASAGFHGVLGATMSGIEAACSILGQGPRSIFDATGQNLRIVPSEHPELWPEDLQAKLPQPLEAADG